MAEDECEFATLTAKWNLLLASFFMSAVRQLILNNISCEWDIEVLRRIATLISDSQN